MTRYPNHNTNHNPVDISGPYVTLRRTTVQRWLVRTAWAMAGFAVLGFCVGLIAGGVA